MKDLTSGKPTGLIIAFAIPMIIGNLFQQMYNVVDSIIVGQFVGKNALAAVSSGFAVITVVLMVGALVGLDVIMKFMNIPKALYVEAKNYLGIIFAGLFFVFLYNAMGSLLRALGDSKTPLYFLILSAVLNIVLDLVFVLGFNQGVQGVALATLIAQGVSALLCVIYSFKKLSILHMSLKEIVFDKEIFKITAKYAVLTSMQQSIMNFGILMVQGLVNSFGASAMAAFGVATKIDAFAYMPVQDFGNAFATYVAQNEGAGKRERVFEGVRCVVKMICLFCVVISLLVIIFSEQLMLIFIQPEEIEVIAIGVEYLRVVAMFYVLIGFLFMYYGFYRGIGNVQMSIVLTVISLGARVVLAYTLAAIPAIGLIGIWWAIPIGWTLADVIGYSVYRKYKHGCV